MSTRLTRDDLTAAITAIRLVADRIERDLDQLMVRVDAPDGYPTGGDGGRSCDISDPVLRAVFLREKHLTPAGKSLHRFWIAAQTLVSADTYRATAIPAEITQNVGDRSIWCANCLQYDKREPRDGDGSILCGFCADTKRELGGLPPRWLLELHWQGRRPAERDIDRARRELSEDGAPSTPQTVLTDQLEQLAREPGMAGATLLGALDKIVTRSVAALDAAKMLKKKRRARQTVGAAS